MNIPEGFKKYLKIMLSDGTLVEPASCWLVNVDVFSERDLVEAVKVNRLDDVAKWYDAQDLAPVMRKGLRPNQVWLFEATEPVGIDQFASLVISAPTEERAWEILGNRLNKWQSPKMFGCRPLDPPADYEGVVISDFRAG